MKVALVCTGLGRIYRGFESFTASLFQALRDYAPHIDVTLFQGGGMVRKRCVIVPNFHRENIPARWFNSYTANLLEQRSFALLLYPMLMQGKYDIVHYNELVMGSALFHLRRCFGGKFKLLYINGAPSPPIHYHHRCDFAQMLTPPAFEEAREFGLPENRLFLIPYGVDAHRFSPKIQSARYAIRHELGIPEEAKVVLTVSALNRGHKRIDYIMKEVAAIRDSVWFVAAGQRTADTVSLEEEAQDLLSGRWRFVSWPHDRIHLLYEMADIFVLASLTEGLPNVLLEAMASGLNIVTHNGPLYQWVIGKANALVIDLTKPKALTEAVNRIANKAPDPGIRSEAVKRFSWEVLMPQYLNMYDQVMTSMKGIHKNNFR